MAKNTRIIKLVSEEKPTHFYTTTVPTRGVKSATKLRLRKYNPRAMKHMWYRESRKLK